MKPIRVSACLVFVASFFLTICAHAQSPSSATGAIEGRVKNAVSGENLKNARVAIKGTNRMVFTDDSGSYRLNEVPAGPTTLRVFFTGLDEQEVAVSVA